MDQSYIVPFVKSVHNVFQTMLSMQVEVGAPAAKPDPEPTYDVSAIIGMSGDVEGQVVLSFPRATAQRVVSLFVGTDLEIEDEDFADAVGELINMVTGGAKAQFPGGLVSISCPSVILGRDHTIATRKDTMCITIPCDCDCGEFSVEVLFRQRGAAAKPGDSQATAAA